jgi:RNA polymerase sigma-70 factor, ECF subfamily
MVTQSTDDYALMLRIVAQDATALAALYDRHAGLVYTLCLRIVRDRQDAEDLLVDVFWELWSKCDRYNAARGSPLTYLLTMARSRAIDRRRAQGRRPVTQSTNVFTGDNGDHGRPDAASPLGDAMTKELGEKMRAAMSRLEPAQRQAVEMSFFDDLSHSQIAQQLGKPLGTVKTYIRQGLIHLREIVRMD